MERDKYDYSEIRMRGFAIIAPKYLEDKFAGYHGGIGVFLALGATQEQAESLMAELSLSLDHNSLPGGITTLPEYDPKEKINRELIDNTPMLHNTAWFTLGYIEDATERGNQSARYMGESWLGNSEEETKNLLKRFQEDPKAVSSFVRWAFEDDPSLESMLNEFDERASNNTLRPPSFE
ncbi:MAG: hypothetical protein Q7T54_02900 [Candidatus Levybacteria bacterium]|nr:hypothetical protein [Candidatus Levybacteria bacterium]